MITKPEIFTEEFVLKEVQDMLKTLNENKRIIFKGELIDPKPYTNQRYAEWRKKFKDITEISATMDKIDGILLSRAVIGGLRSDLSPVMTKFHLINNFDWRDKSETEVSGKGGKDLFPTPILPLNAISKDNSNSQDNGAPAEA